jgi:hypothetical protein
MSFLAAYLYALIVITTINIIIMVWRVGYTRH